MILLLIIIIILVIILVVWRRRLMSMLEVMVWRWRGRVVCLLLSQPAGVRRCVPVLLLGLHPPVLEPDLDLPLRQSQRLGQLHPPRAAEVPVVVVLLLQLHQLAGAEGGPWSLGGGDGG